MFRRADSFFLHCIRRAWLFALVSIFVAPLAHAVTYTVGSGCQYPDLQSAVADLVDDSPNFIHVKTGTFVHTAVVVENHSVVITGGYTNCNDANPAAGVKTTLDGASNGNNSVVHKKGTGSLTMQNFTITHGSQGNDSHGGGVNIEGSGAVEFDFVTISLNQCGYGAGINVTPADGDSITLTLNKAQIVQNTAARDGGGIRLEGHTTLNISGGGNAIDSTSAVNDGGGLHIIGPASATIIAQDESLGLFVGNSSSHGGAIAVTTPSNDGADAKLTLASATASIPVGLANNTADFGGAIYLDGYSSGGSSAQSKMCAYDFNFQNNAAGNGSAIMSDEAGSGDSVGSPVYLNQLSDPTHTCAPPPGTVRCTPGNFCNAIRDGISRNLSGTTTAGEEIWIREGSQLLADNLRVVGNRGAYTLHFGQNDGQTSKVRNCLVVENSVTGSLIFADNNSDSPIAFSNCTFTRNVISGPYVFDVSDDVTVQRSIIWQPGLDALIERDNSSALLTHDLVTSSKIGLDPNDQSVILLSGTDDPRFEDAANGDYHLQPASVAVDFTPTIDGSDLEGNPRGVDLPGINNFYGPADLGAFERQSIGNLVRNSTFDGSLNLWTSPSGDTIYDSAQNQGASGSGSAHFTHTNSVGSGANRTEADIALLAQCVALPGFGDYQLSGYLRQFRPPFAVPYGPVTLQWAEFDTSGNCTGTPSNQGSLTLPASNPIGWKGPLAPTVFHAGSGPNYTHHTSVLISAVLSTGAETSDEGWLDGISLVPGGVADRIFFNGFE